VVPYCALQEVNSAEALRVVWQVDSMKVEQLDHIVLTVRNIPATLAFYERVLGLRHVIFDEQYHALHFGSQKINLHTSGNEYQPHAQKPLPGSGDFCFVVSGPVVSVVKNLRLEGVEIEHGPVPQTGAAGKMVSVYFRDPDGNLVELACYR
jgi:catechol 2,3-dioxygenase-like lactoylglutathione lyase family enzyme